MQKNKEFFNKIAKYYDKGIFKNWNKKVNKKIIETANIKKNSKILDAGCGTGNLLMLLQDLEKKKNPKVYGIDISEKMLKIAKAKLKTADLRLQSAENMNFKSNYFNYIFSVDTFHHYSNYDLAMRNFYRILKKNGKLIVVELNFGFIGNKIFHLIEPGNNKMHSKKEFKKLFQLYNFKRIKYKKVSLLNVLTIGKK